MIFENILLEHKTVFFVIKIIFENSSKTNHVFISYM